MTRSSTRSAIITLAHARLLRTIERVALFSGLLVWAIPGHAQQLAWVNTTGGQGDDVVQSMHVDMDGNVLVAGYFEGTVDLDPGPGIEMHTSVGESDVYVQKLASDGSLLWAVNFGGSSSDYATGINTDLQGNVYVTGVFNDQVDLDPGPGVTELVSAGGYDIFLAKFGPDGALIWANGCGGTGYDESKAVAVGALGGVYLLSYFSDTIDADPGTGVLPFTSQGGLDILLQKFDADGVLVWAQPTGSAETDLGLALALDASENIWITGSFEGVLDFDPGPGNFSLTSAGGWDVFVTKRSAEGAFIWAGSMGGSDSFENGYGIAVDGDGSVITVGSYFGTADFDPGPGVHELVASSIGSDEIFVLKLDPSGTFLWAKSIGGTDADLAYGVALASDGRVDVTGFFSGTADFDPDPVGTFEMTTASPDNFFDSFVCELDADGMFLHAWQFAGCNSISTQSIARGTNDALYIAGEFENDPDFDPSALEVDRASNGFRDGFVMRIDPIGTGMSKGRTSTAPLISPNPAREVVLIELDASEVGAAYMIRDMQGRAMVSGRANNRYIRLAVDGFPAGRYEVQVLQKGSGAASFLVVR
ncbi:MAG: hypothetical protein ACOH13_15965 [Flavobacteriales bacterium]